MDKLKRILLYLFITCRWRRHIWVYNMYSTYNVQSSKVMCYLYFSFYMVCIPLFVHVFAHVCSCYSISHFGSICSYLLSYTFLSEILYMFLSSAFSIQYMFIVHVCIKNYSCQQSFWQYISVRSAMMFLRSYAPVRGPIYSCSQYFLVRCPIFSCPLSFIFPSAVL